MTDQVALPRYAGRTRLLGVAIVIAIGGLYLLIWIVVVTCGHVAIVTALLATSPASLLPDVPRNVLLVLGISVGTALGAKAVTANAAQSGKDVKTSARNALAGPLFQTDDGRPDLGKIQLLAFTFVAVAVFLFGIFDALARLTRSARRLTWARCPISVRC